MYENDSTCTHDNGPVTNIWSVKLSIISKTDNQQLNGVIT